MTKFQKIPLKEISLVKIMSLCLIIINTSCSYKVKQSLSPVVTMEEFEYEEIINKKYSHPLVIKSFDNAAQFTKSQKSDLQKLRKIIVAKNHQKDEELLKKIKDNLQKELKYLQNFNQVTASLTFYDFDESVIDPTLEPNYVSPQLKYNKLDIFIKKALEFSDQKLIKIINGKIIAEIYQGENFFPAPDRTNIRSDTTVPAVTIIMLEALKIIDEKTYQQYVQNSLNEGSLFYWYAAPKKQNIDMGSIFNAKNQGMEGVILVHNGYSFGGSIGADNIRKDGFHTMPHDCSSFISNLIDLGTDPITRKNNILWTSDAQNLVNLILNKNYVSLKDLRKNLSVYGRFAEKMNIVEPVNISDFKEGDLLMFRKFSSEIFGSDKKSNSLGKGGHIGVVMGTDDKGRIFIVSYIRNYEKFGTGGFLISAISLKNLQDKSYSTILFRSKI